MNDIIEGIEDAGNMMIDDCILPAIRTGKDIILDTSVFKSLKSFHKHSVENKINIFVNSINRLSHNDIVHTIENMNSDEKQFFTETIHKSIDLNDTIQINVLAYLTSEYLIKGELSNWQKRLYYQISNLSEDDFKSYCLVVETSKRYERYGNEYYTLSCENVELDIIKDQFINIGILIPQAKERLDNTKNFSIPYHGREFYELLIDIIKENKPK